MRHATLYHLRALLRPLKRRVLPRGSSKGKGRAVSCNHHHHRQSHSGYDPLLPTDDEEEEEEEEAIELLPPARIVTDPGLLARPTSAPGPSSLTPPSSPWRSSRPPPLASSSTASTCTLASSSSASYPSSFGPSTPATTCASDTSSALQPRDADNNQTRNRKKSRRETWTRSLMALDSLFFEGGEHTSVDVGADQGRRSVRETKRDSFMWMKFDGHTGGAVAWADGVRLAGGVGV